MASVHPAQPSLDTWLSIQPSASSSASQTSSPSAASPEPGLITYSKCTLEKDSIFISTCFPLTSVPRTTQIQSILNQHLSPPRHESLPQVVQKNRGINPSHRMYAWRALGLKAGTRGTSPNDFVVEEGSEDDDEKWGGDRLLKVMRDADAVDCLLVCSRWFGGSLLGPIRFQHIEDTGREALRAHLQLADIFPLKQELLARDTRIAHLKSLLPSPPNPPPARPKETYDSLDSVDKAERLLTARAKLLEGLEKKVKDAEDATNGKGEDSLVLDVGGDDDGKGEGDDGRAEPEVSRSNQARESVKRAVERVLAEDENEEEVGGVVPVPASRKKQRVIESDEEE